MFLFFLMTFTRPLVLGVISKEKKNRNRSCENVVTKCDFFMHRGLSDHSPRLLKTRLTNVMPALWPIDYSEFDNNTDCIMEAAGRAEIRRSAVHCTRKTTYRHRQIYYFWLEAKFTQVLKIKGRDKSWAVREGWASSCIQTGLVN